MFGYLICIGEVITALMTLFRIPIPLATLVVATNMIVTLLLVHTSQFFTLDETGRWTLEPQGMYVVAVALLGTGRYSIGGTAGHGN